MSTVLPLTPDEVLTTTRAVRRRLDFDRPVDLELVKECLEIAVQAPTGANHQDWHFVVVTDPDLRGALAEIYRRTSPAEAARAAKADPRLLAGAEYLHENIQRVPVLLVPCI